MEELLVPAGTRAGEYEITGPLGRGGMGLVYCGVHPLIGTKVAIKTIHPGEAGNTNLVRRFLQEARAVNKIGHTNIVDIFAFGESAELGHYLVMPLLQGQTLAERIVQGPLLLSDALPILRQIADALDAAHAAGICHRDLKPENIFLVAQTRGPDHVKVLDFGIAKLSDSASVHKTAEHQQIGTPLYMSPEQWDGAEIDHRADIYAFGVLVHHILTGRYPFESKSVLQLMHMHGTQAPAPASEHGAPVEVDPVVARALAKDREDRFASVGETYEALAGLDESYSESIESVATGTRKSSSLPIASADPLTPAFADTIADTAAATIADTPERVESTLRLRRNSRWPMAAALLACLGAGLLVFRLVTGSASSPTATSEQAAVQRGESEDATGTSSGPGKDLDDVDEPEAKIQLVIDSNPAGSTLWLNGELLGETPFRGSVPAADLGEFVLTHKGYETRRFRRDLRSSVQERFELARKPAQAGIGSTDAGASTQPSEEEMPKWGETVNPF